MSPAAMSIAQVIANLAGLAGSGLLLWQGAVSLSLRREVKKTFDQAHRTPPGEKDGADFLKEVAGAVEETVDRYRPWHGFTFVGGAFLLGVSYALPLLAGWFG